MSAYIIGMLSNCCDCIVYNGILTTHARGVCSNCDENNGWYDAVEKERLEQEEYEKERHRLEIFNKFDEYGVGYNL